MKLLMAVSADGFVARGPDDDMRWTGALDKAIFRLLTMGEVVGAGRVTYGMMRDLKLKGRDLRLITSNPGAGFTLDSFARNCPRSWLIGGHTAALGALDLNLIDRVYLSVVGVELGQGVKLDHRFRTLFPLIDTIEFPTAEGVNDVKVEVRGDRI